MNTEPGVKLMRLILLMLLAVLLGLTAIVCAAAGSEAVPWEFVTAERPGGGGDEGVGDSSGTPPPASQSPPEPVTGTLVFAEQWSPGLAYVKLAGTWPDGVVVYTRGEMSRLTVDGAAADEAAFLATLEAGEGTARVTVYPDPQYYMASWRAVVITTAAPPASHPPPKPAGDGWRFDPARAGVNGATGWYRECPPVTPAVRMGRAAPSAGHLLGTAGRAARTPPHLNEHRHVCDRCGYSFWHHDSNFGDPNSHTCPRCGNLEWRRAGEGPKSGGGGFRAPYVDTGYRAPPPVLRPLMRLQAGGPNCPT